MPHWPTGAITTLLCIFFLLPPSFTSLHGMLRTSAKDHYPLRFNDDVQVSDELCGEICKPVIDIKKIEDLLNEVRYLDTERLLFGKSVAYHLAEPLKKAICTNNLRILDSLVLAGGDVDDGLIHTARNNPAAIRYLLAHGADIIPPVKRTPSDIVTMLLARHLTNRPYTFNMDGDTVLYQATRNKNLEVMQVLLAYSAQLTDKKEEFGNIPLMSLKDDFDALMQNPEDKYFWERICNRFGHEYYNFLPSTYDKLTSSMHQVENVIFMLLAYGADPNKFLQDKPLGHEHRNSMLDITYLKTMFDTAHHADQIITGQEQPRIDHLDTVHQWLFIWRLLSAGREDIVDNLKLPRRTLEVEIMRNWFTSRPGLPLWQRFYDEKTRMTEENLFDKVIQIESSDEFGELKQKFMELLSPIYKATLMLHIAVKKGDIAGIKNAISEGADINGERDSSGRSPLLRATKSAEPGYHLDVMHLLLQHQANPNLCDSEGNTPLHFATHPTTCRMLLAHGANPNIRTHDTKCTPLEVALHDLEQWIIDYNSLTNWHSADDSNCLERIRYLLSYNADLTPLKQCPTCSQHRTGDFMKRMTCCNELLCSLCTNYALSCPKCSEHIPTDNPSIEYQHALYKKYSWKRQLHTDRLQRSIDAALHADEVATGKQLDLSCFKKPEKEIVVARLLSAGKKDLLESFNIPQLIQEVQDEMSHAGELSPTSPLSAGSKGFGLFD